MLSIQPAADMRPHNRTLARCPKADPRARFVLDRLPPVFDPGGTHSGLAAADGSQAVLECLAAVAETGGTRRRRKFRALSDSQFGFQHAPSQSSPYGRKNKPSLRARQVRSESHL